MTRVGERGAVPAADLETVCRLFVTTKRLPDRGNGRRVAPRGTNSTEPGAPFVARILVIDDNAELRTVLGQTLESAGYQVALAGDGIQGMAACSANPVDLVVTDLVMPQQEGMETIMQLRRDFPKVAIIAMSGMS